MGENQTLVFLAPGDDSAITRKLVRSQAMADWRRRQRQQQQKPLKPKKRAPVAATATAKDLQHLKQAAKEDQPQKSPVPGKDPVPNASHEDSDPMARHQHRSAKLISTGVNSPLMTREALMGVFITGVLPSRDRSSSTVAAVAQQWMNVQCPAMRAANDSVALLEIGLSGDHADLILEGRKRHLAAVQLLRQDLSSKDPDISGTHAAIRSLLFCEMFSVISQGAASQHLAGLNAIIERGKSRKTPFNLTLMRCTRFQTIMASIISGTANCLGPDEWPLSHDGSAESELDLLMPIVAGIPGLREALNDCRSSTDSPDPLLLTDSLHLRDDLQSWLQNYYQSRDITDLSSVPWEDSQPASPLPLRTHGLFPSIPNFQNFLDANLHCIYWISQMTLLQLLSDIHSHLLAHSPKEAETVRREHLEAIDHFADLLCQTIIYFMIHADGMTCKAMTVKCPLHFATQHFRRRQSQDKLLWCEELQALLERELPQFDWDPLVVWNVFPLMWLGA